MAGIDWEALERSEVWVRDILPALKERQREILVQMLSTDEPGQMNFLRGQAKAYNDLIEQPEMARIMRERAEQATEAAVMEEATDDERGRDTDRRKPWIRRWQRVGI